MWSLGTIDICRTQTKQWNSDPVLHFGTIGIYQTQT